MRTIYGIVILFVIIFFIYLLERGNSRNVSYDKRIFLVGHITNMKVSNNHAFGIYTVDVDSANKYAQMNANVKYFPFRLGNGICEIYGTISHDDSLGDLIILDVMNNSIAVKNESNEIVSESYFYLIDDPLNIKFIRENSIFKMSY